MISRMVHPDEFARTEDLFCIAFEFKAGEKPYISPKCTQRFASFTEEGDMMAFLCSPAEEVFFDGNKVKMCCVGAVSCLPHYRRGGALKGAFVKSLDYAYETGVELSALYPFSSAYYRRFGYEYVINKAQYKLSIAAIKPFDYEGRFYLNENASELAAIKEVYYQYAKKYNFMFTRADSTYFEEFEKNKPTHDGIYTYVYKTGDDEMPKGVISFEKAAVDGGFNMRCRAFWFTCSEGCRALLTHAKGFAAYYNMLELNLPIDFDLHNFIDEWALYPMEYSVLPVCMMRVINVKKALLAAKYKGSGEVVLDITDNILKQNNGTWRVVFENDRAILCELTNKPPHARLTMPRFTKCLLGAQSAEELLQSEGAEIFSPEPLEKIFYKKPSYITNGF